MNRKILLWVSIGTAILFILNSNKLALGEDRPGKEPVEWVDISGKYTVTARFRRLDGEAVILRLNDGRDMRIPLNQLSSESVEQAKAMASGRFAAKEKANADLAATTPSSASSLSKSSLATPSRSPGATSNLDAKQFVDKIMADVKQNKFISLWDALPEGKQKDVEDLVGAFAKQLDSRTFEMVRKTRNTVFEIARKQQQFILNSTVLAYPSEQKAILEKSYPALVSHFESMLPKELFDNKRLQNGELRELLNDWSNGIVASAAELAKTIPEGTPLRAQLLGMPDLPYTIEPMSDGEAKLSIKPPNPTGPPQDMEIVLVQNDGRWLPKDMVNDWDNVMGQAKAAIATIKGEQVHQQVSAALFLANAPLQSLKNAKTQEEFDKVLKGFVETAQNVAMGSMGGMGPGGFPPGGLPPGGLPPGGVPGGFPPPGSQPPPADANSGAGNVSNEK